jgi:branched-chain amino acid transport system ATP-binding protein
MDGKRIENENPEVIAAMGVSHVAEGHRVLQHLTVEENLRLGCYAKGGGHNLKTELEVVYNYFPRLRMLRSQPSGYISGGEQQMLAIGQGLITHPRLLLLDEPSLGLAPLLIRTIYGVIKKMSEEEGTSLLIVEQNAKAALSIAGYGYVMESGMIVLDGPAEKLKGDKDIKEFYLGLSAIGNKKSYGEVKHYKRRKRWLA